MNALASYIRHLIVTGIIILAEKFKLPVDGIEDAANYIALAVIGTGTWLITKYGKEIKEKVTPKE